jgi:hypothetical protein
MGGSRALLPLLLALLAALWPGPARADNWSLQIASWNLLNFGDSKAGIAPQVDRTALLDFYAGKISQYDIVFIQEVLNEGHSVSVALAQRPLLQNYNCSTVSAPSGRAGRKERYAVCYTSKNGLLAVAQVVDWMGPNTMARAPDGSMQAAQQVWMRPPLQVTFVFTPTAGNGAPFTFTIATAHTKPCYSNGPRPAGTPQNTPKLRSVANELNAIQQNLAPAQPGAWALIGDLNASCDYFTRANQPAIFPAPRWDWLVQDDEKTNTGLTRDCAYDRIILDGGFAAAGVYEAGNYWIDSLGIAAPPQSGRRVSDHHLVSFRIGKRNPLKRASLVAVADGVADPQRVVQPRRKLHFRGANLPAAASSQQSKLYIATYDKNRFTWGHAPMPLTDVRGAPTPVTVQSDGSFAALPVWDSTVAGAYSILLDVDGNGFFDKFDRDFASFNNIIDFLVAPAAHSPLASIDDDGRQREVFNENRAHHVYALARGLTPGATVRSYVVADALLPPDTDLVALKVAGTFQLASASVPVRLWHGPLVPSALAEDLKYELRPVAPDGSMFGTAWTWPSNLFNMEVHSSRTASESPARGQACAEPARIPAGLTLGPAQGPTDPDPGADEPDDPDDPDDPGDIDQDLVECMAPAPPPGARMAPPTLSVDDVLPTRFSDHYGSRFNLVIDANANGILDSPDLVDFHDVGDMQSFFADPANTVLDARANGHAAVQEYKEFLNAKLSLATPLTNDSRFDSATVAASIAYLCQPGLPKAAFDRIVVPASRNGFTMFDQMRYEQRRQFSSGLYQYADALIDTASVPANASVCVTGDYLAIHGMTVSDGASVTVRGNETSMSGSSVLNGFLSIFSRGFSSRELEIRLPADPPDPTRPAMSWHSEL